MRLVNQRIKNALGFDDTWFMLGGIFLIAITIPLVFLQESFNEVLAAPYLTKFGIALIYTIVYWVSIRSLIIQLRTRFPSYRETRKRLALTIVLGGGLYIVLNQLLDFFVHDCMMPEDFPHEVSKVTMNIVSSSLVVIISTLYESVFLYDRWKVSIIEKEKLEKIHVQSQLESLRNQVNPHFLFNSLNTLAYIIPEDPERGVNFVQKLSRVYRYILEMRDKKLVSLEEELNFLNSYLSF